MVAITAHRVHRQRRTGARQALATGVEAVALPLTWLLLAAGCLLAFVSALVPHFDAGHRLAVSVLLSGLLPYLAYALLLPYLRGWLLLGPALLVVVVHGWTVANERFIAYQGYSDGLIHAVPLVLGALVLALFAWALHRHPCGGE